MVLPVLRAIRREKLVQFKNLMHAFSILKYSYLEIFLNVIPDILNVLFINVAMILPH